MNRKAKPRKKTAWQLKLHELDETKLLQRVQDMNITMCGYAPVITCMVAAKALGATKSMLIKYQTSGDITNDLDSVVGYSGIIIY